jgi:hypothetical protein
VRVGPTTPKRARRLADASVDPTEARNDMANGALCHLVEGRRDNQNKARQGESRSSGRRAEAVEPLGFRVGEELDGHGGLFRGSLAPKLLAKRSPRRPA